MNPSSAGSTMRQSWPTFGLTGLAILVLAAIFGASGVSFAATLIGRVVDPGAVGVPGINIDLVDEATGDEVVIMNDSTDANGDFSIVVPDNLTYEITFITSLGMRLLTKAVGGVVVTTGTADMGTTPLEAAALLTAQVVRSDTMLPVVGADTDVDISATGDRVITPGDNTDATGVFAILVPFTTVDLTIEPQKIQKLVASEIKNITIVGDTDLGVLQVDPGAILSGTVRRASDNTVVEAADIDVFDATTGNKLPTAGDNTDEFGVFSVIVPFATIDYSVQPVKSDRLVAIRTNGLTIAADTNVGTVLVEAGALLSGTVVRASGGAAVVGADTDAADAYTGVSVITVGDNTDATGQFDVVVPFGVVDFAIEPDASEHLVAKRYPDLDIVADTNLGVVSLDDGFLVSGTVSGPSGVVPGVSVAVYDMSTGERIPTPGSVSAADGTYRFVLPAGTFLAEWSPDIEDGTGRLFVPSFMVSGDMVFDPALTASVAGVTIGETGHLINTGDRYAPLVSVRNNSGASLAVRALLTAEIPSRGIVKTVQAPIDKTLPGNPRVIAKTVRIRIPVNVNPALLGIPVHIVVQLVDPSSGTLFDEDRIEFRIR